MDGEHEDCDCGACRDTVVVHGGTAHTHTMVIQEQNGTGAKMKHGDVVRLVRREAELSPTRIKQGVEHDLDWWSPYESIYDTNRVVLGWHSRLKLQRNNVVGVPGGWAAASRMGVGNLQAGRDSKKRRLWTPAEGRLTVLTRWPASRHIRSATYGVARRKRRHPARGSRRFLFFSRRRREGSRRRRRIPRAGGAGRRQFIEKLTHMRGSGQRKSNLFSVLFKRKTMWCVLSSGPVQAQTEQSSVQTEEKGCARSR